MFLNLGSKIHSTHYNFYEFLFIRSNILRKIPFVRSDFPRSKFNFLQRLSHFREIRENLLQRLSNFFNGFPISSPAFRFLKRLSDFFNGFPLSEKSGKIYLWRQIYERSLSELRISRPKSRYSAIK